MSSSNYEPEQGDERSDTKLESKQSSSAVQTVPVPLSPQNAQTLPECPPTEHQNARKRRRSRAKTREKTFWSLRFQLSRESAEAYSKLLAGVSGDTTSAPAEPSDDGKSYNVTQNGIVIWTSKEKETLYTLLDRKGKNGIKEIAAAIGTKSELEVQEHLRLLQRGLERQHLRDRHTRTVILGDVPAAAEVRGECGRVLDRYAELMRLEEQYLENVAGRKKHYDAWVIDREKAGQIDEEIKEEEDKDKNEEEEQDEKSAEDRQGTEERGKEAKEEQEGSEEVDEEEGEEEERIKIISYNPTIHLTASLFNMEKWTRLSERFFMNFGGPRLEDNWANVAYPGESPSLTADAFADFYALTMSVTRRLVQSSLFFAMSRIRRMRDTGHRKAQIIKTRDVKTALSVLNMKQDCSDIWPGLARRCSLDVVDYRHRKGWKSVYMDHNQVKDVLSGDVSHKTNPDGTEPPKSQELAVDGIAGNNDNDSDSDVRSSPEPMVEENQLYLSLEDEHAETVDQEKSNLEEQRLWTLLGHQAPVNLDASVKPESEDGTRASQRPTGERKTKEDLVDWRDRTLYRSEWEEYGNDIFDIYEDISKGRQKRRRIFKEPLWQPSRLASPASVSLLANPVRDVEMDTGAQEVDLRAVKPEGGGSCEEVTSEAMDISSIADRDSAERDQKPILSIENEALKYNDQNAFRNSYESESESESDEDHKPPRHMIKHEPSEDEGSESMSEPEDKSTETDQKPNITNDNPRDDDQSESLFMDTESLDEEDHQQKQRIKRDPSEGEESENEDTETDRKPRISHDGHSYEKDESKHKTSSEYTTSDNEDTQPPFQTASINNQPKQEPESESDADADAESSNNNDNDETLTPSRLNFEPKQEEGDEDDADEKAKKYRTQSKSAPMSMSPDSEDGRYGFSFGQQQYY